MQLVAVILTIHVITQLGTVAQAKDLTVLLTGNNARSDLSGAVALLPLVGIGIGLDGQAEVLGANQHQVLDVVGIQVVGLGAGRALSNGSNAIPGHTLVIEAGGADGIENSMINTSFVKTFTGLVPYDFTHFGFPPFNSTG